MRALSGLDLVYGVLKRGELRNLYAPVKVWLYDESGAPMLAKAELYFPKEMLKKPTTAGVVLNVRVKLPGEADAV